MDVKALLQKNLRATWEFKSVKLKRRTSTCFKREREVTKKMEEPMMKFKEAWRDFLVRVKRN